ncbi:MAG TPA: FAD-dependent monooxygenase, partial [Microvirga sp.]|nr:FAD-dependent monooxygenase [Microvirga sp.]
MSAPEVLIVGAGPTGLVLALWLNRLGVRLRIVDANTGGTPPTPNLIIRYIGYVISMIPLGLGYFWMLWDERR